MAKPRDLGAFALKAKAPKGLIYSEQGQSLQELGIKTLLHEQDYSCVLTSFQLPLGYSYEQIHDTLKDAGFIIYAGQGGLRNAIFRIANMGDIQPEDVERLLHSLQVLFQPTLAVKV